jgi:CHAD domain-containing protein
MKLFPPQPQGEPVAEFLRRHVLAQAGIIRQTEDGVRAGLETPLHDLRVAIRRLRSLLRDFREPLAATRATGIEAGFDRLLKELGPARDTDVWMLFLKRNPVLRRGASARFLAAQQEEKQRHQVRIRARLEGGEYRVLKTDLNRLIEEELKPGTRRVPRVPTDELGRRALRKALRRIRRRARGLPDLPPDKMHKLRIACRKARYLAEFLSGAWEAPLDDMARRFKSIQDVLGDIHDQDVYLEHLRTCRPRPPRALVHDIRRRRERDRARFEKAWKQFMHPCYQQKLEQAFGLAGRRHS